MQSGAQALKLHPDKNTSDPTATEKFQAISKAYQVHFAACLRPCRRLSAFL